MVATIELGDLLIHVIQKDIKNVHLNVYPPAGQVRISAPLHMNLDTIRAFVVSKLDWIKRAQKKLRNQEREAPREYIDRESHQVWGEHYLLQVVVGKTSPRVEVKCGMLVLQVRSGTDRDHMEAIVARWYRQQIRDAVPDLIQKWEPLMRVQVEKIFVQHMKTRWGSCNSTARNIRLNSELAKKPREFLEYVVVHELAHLLEASHNQKFIAIMDRFMPMWRNHRDALNQLPVRHENREY
jgi:predicted metal-dependent hydrolase